jgi:hypothetical protein
LTDYKLLSIIYVNVVYVRGYYPVEGRKKMNVRIISGPAKEVEKQVNEFTALHGIWKVEYFTNIWGSFSDTNYGKYTHVIVTAIMTEDQNKE